MEKLIDNFGRKLDCMRISVTDRCNLRCLYCMPNKEIKLKNNQEILSYDEIFRITKIFINLGITRIKITGGEPLVRKDIVKLIYMISSIKEIEDISMTTNGVLLSLYAKQLKEAGLKRLNISLDTLYPARYKYLTKKDNFNMVIEGIKIAMETGFSLLKINVVLLDINEDEIERFLNLSISYPLHIRFLEFMPINKLYRPDTIVLGDKVIQIAKQISDFIPVEVYGNYNCKYFKFFNAKGTFGIITPMSDKFCNKCNRLRLTADGYLKLCLNSNSGINLKWLLRNKTKDEEIKNIIKKVILNKPLEHDFNYQNIQKEFSMCQIGG